MIYEPALLMNTINGFAAKKNTNMRFRKFALNEYMCGVLLLSLYISIQNYLKLNF